VGALNGLSPPNKAPSPPNWNMKQYRLREFLSPLNVKPPLHERKPPLLTPFWRRFCIRKHKCRKWRGRRRPWPLPTFWNLTFSYYIFSKKGCLLSFEWKKWNFTIFAHPTKILDFTWKILLLPPLVHNVWLIMDNWWNTMLWWNMQ